MCANDPPRILLHICCGPCATYPVPWLLEHGYDVTGFYYNPNIHPYTEYRMRRQGLEQYAQQCGLKVIYDEMYDPTIYFQQITHHEAQRCGFCYQMRMEKTAEAARQGNYDGFSTTLLVSKYQKHDLIKEIGEKLAEKYQVPFLYHDFREGFAETGERSRGMGLYRQKYCGCLYSEMERYAPRRLVKQVFKTE